jgi:hypothetical protein
MKCGLTSVAKHAPATIVQKRLRVDLQMSGGHQKVPVSSGNGSAEPRIHSGIVNARSELRKHWSDNAVLQLREKSGADNACMRK